MKERPILFQGAMVRALLAGTKTQTRRVVKGERASRGMESGWLLKPYGFLSDRQFAKAASPYGRPGDRLWVRESWGYFDPDGTGEDYDRDHNDEGKAGPCGTYCDEMLQEGNPLRDYWRRRIAYAATWQDKPYGSGVPGPKRWRPSIHMPRWASRITLEVTGVRVERLQDISEADAIAEGIHKPVGSQFWHSNDLAHLWDGGGGLPGDTPQRAYRSLWNSINLPPSPVQERIGGKLVTVAYVSYPWSMEDFEQAHPGVAAAGLYRGKPLTITPNPWVWVISFRRNT